MSAEVIHRRQAPRRRVELRALFAALNTRWCWNLGMTLAVTVLLIVLAVAGSRWHTVTGANGKFSVSMPGWVWRQEQSVPTPAGTMSAYSCTVVQMLHGATYEVGYSAYPKGVASLLSDNLLDMMSDTALGKMGGKLLVSRNFTQGGYAGRDLTVQAPSRGKVRLRILATETQVYMLMVSPVPWRDGEARVKRFFESFRLRD